MKKTLLRNLPVFFIICLASILLWQTVFSRVCAPKREETLQIFVTANVCHQEKIRQTLGVLPVKAVEVSSCSSTANHYQESLVTAGILNSDLLIVEASVFDPEYAYQEFAPLDARLLESYGLAAADYSYVERAGEQYAIIIYDESLGISLLSDYLQVCDPEKQYCIAVNRNLPNAAPYGQALTDNAFRALAKLLK